MFEGLTQREEEEILRDLEQKGGRPLLTRKQVIEMFDAYYQVSDVQLPNSHCRRRHLVNNCPRAPGRASCPFDDPLRPY